MLPLPTFPVPRRELVPTRELPAIDVPGLMPTDPDPGELLVLEPALTLPVPLPLPTFALPTLPLPVLPLPVPVWPVPELLPVPMLLPMPVLLRVPMLLPVPVLLAPVLLPALLELAEPPPELTLLEPGALAVP